MTLPHGTQKLTREVKRVQALGRGYGLGAEHLLWATVRNGGKQFLNFGVGILFRRVIPARFVYLV